MMSGSLTKFTLLAALAAPLIAPGAVFAQVCSPTDSSMNRCPPINDGGGARLDHRPDERPYGANGMHPGNGMLGNPGARAAGGGFGGVGGGAHAAGGGGGALPSGAGPGGGMGHGGAAGGVGGGAAAGAGGGHGK
jgi:hypothetical protein